MELCYNEDVLQPYHESLFQVPQRDSLWQKQKEPLHKKLRKKQKLLKVAINRRSKQILIVNIFYQIVVDDKPKKYPYVHLTYHGPVSGRGLGTSVFTTIKRAEGVLGNFIRRSKQILIVNIFYQIVVDDKPKKYPYVHLTYHGPVSGRGLGTSVFTTIKRAEGVLGNFMSRYRNFPRKCSVYQFMENIALSTWCCNTLLLVSPKIILSASAK